jgi:serine/threonine protein kinase
VRVSRGGALESLELTTSAYALSPSLAGVGAGSHCTRLCAILHGVSLPPDRPTPLAPGFKLDRYELLCPIAEGGMASVWIARHSGKHGFEKFVAIKTVLPKFASDPRFQQMFQDEARIASRIEHTNVAQILDVGEQNEVTYLVMEYVDGESLSTVQRALVKKGMKVPAGVALRVMADVCGGLHTAHELRESDGELLGVVHRDVSPQNVLVSMKGVAKLIDFGIAKARDRVAGDTASGQVKGKIRYMAPEQALGSAIDRRADIWAVGAILYHLLSGKPPYDGDNDVQTLLVLTSGRPPVPLPADVHPAVAAVVKRALSASMDSRFATAADLQQAIEDAIVEARIGTNIASVAAFLTEHVPDRAKRRKEAIAIGVKAAADRDRYAQIMRSNVTVTSGASGMGHPSGESTGSGSHNGVAPNADSRSRSGVGSSPGSAPGLGSSGLSGGTLGSAAMEVASGSPLRRRTVAVAGAAVGGLLAVVGLIVLLTHQPSAPIEANAAKQSALVTSPVPGPMATSVPTVSWTATTIAPNAATTDANASPPAATVPVLQTSPATTAATTPIPAPGPVPHFSPPRPAVKPGHTKTRVDDGF